MGVDRDGFLTGVGCLIVLFNLFWVGLIVWGVIELILLIQRS